MPPSIFQKGTAQSCPERFNLAHYVLSGSGADDDASALEVFSTPTNPVLQLTYGDLRARVASIAAGLARAGLKPGDRLLLRIGNTADFPLVYLAANLIGALPVPSSTQLTQAELDYILTDLQPHMICVAGGQTPLPNPPCPQILQSDLDRYVDIATPLPDPVTHRDDPAYIIYTSGTSGKPRAVLHAQRAVWARRMMWTDWYGLEPSDRMLHAGSFNWTYTLGTGLMDPWARGATALIYSGPPDPGIWPALADAQSATIFAAAPGVYRQMLRVTAKGAFSGIRHGLCAGEKLPHRTAKLWEEITGKPLYEALGMTEISTFISTGPGARAREGATGRPQRGRRIAVVDDSGTPVPVGEPGVLAVNTRDPGFMLEYRGQPEETAAKIKQGWFLTGDSVSMDADGYVTYLGRNDDMMNAGGFRVSPLEVEAALLSHPDIHEAAAVETPISADASIIVAHIVTQRDLADEALTAYCAQRLARYKCPRAFVRADALPRNANGKLRRADLRSVSPNSG